MGRPRDSQRQAVYRWELAVAQLVPADFRQTLTLPQCQQLVDQVAHAYYRELHVTVTDGRGCRSAAQRGRTIVLPRWARTHMTVLHETAHAILSHYETSVDRVAWHGAEFATLVLDLWAQYGGIPKGAARSLGVHQRPRRVRFAPAHKVIQPYTREYLAWLQQTNELRNQLRRLASARPDRSRRQVKAPTPRAAHTAFTLARRSIFDETRVSPQETVSPADD